MFLRPQLFGTVLNEATLGSVENQKSMVLWKEVVLHVWNAASSG